MLCSFFFSVTLRPGRARPQRGAGLKRTPTHPVGAQHEGGVFGWAWIGARSLARSAGSAGTASPPAKGRAAGEGWGVAPQRRASGARRREAVAAVFVVVAVVGVVWERIPRSPFVE